MPYIIVLAAGVCVLALMIWRYAGAYYQQVRRTAEARRRLGMELAQYRRRSWTADR